MYVFKVEYEDLQGKITYGEELAPLEIIKGSKDKLKIAMSFEKNDYIDFFFFKGNRPSEESLKNFTHNIGFTAHFLSGQETSFLGKLDDDGMYEVNRLNRSEFIDLLIENPGKGNYQLFGGSKHEITIEGSFATTTDQKAINWLKKDKQSIIPLLTEGSK